ncbi:hypothetical protein [Spirosoma linguale]
MAPQLEFDQSSEDVQDVEKGLTVDGRLKSFVLDQGSLLNSWMQGIGFW